MVIKYIPQTKDELKRLDRRYSRDQIDVSNITDMRELFLSSIYNHLLDSWDVSNVTNRIVCLKRVSI